MADTNTQSSPVVESTPAAPITEPKAPSKRSIALKALRAATPAKSLADAMVLLPFEAAKVARRSGSKASKCVEVYKPGATVKAIVEAAPLDLQSYCRACLVWDLQHGNISFETPAAPAKV